MVLTYPLKIHIGLATEVRREGHPQRIRTQCTYFTVKINRVVLQYLSIQYSLFLDSKPVKTHHYSSLTFHSTCLFSSKKLSSFQCRVNLPSFEKSIQSKAADDPQVSIPKKLSHFNSTYNSVLSSVIPFTSLIAARISSVGSSSPVFSW